MSAWPTDKLTSYVRIALLMCVVCPASVHAEITSDTQRAVARALGTEGLTAFERGDFAAAADRFDRAYQLHPVPTLALWSGRSLARTGKLVAASERWLDASRMNISGGMEEAQLAAQREAVEERNRLLPRIPSLQIDLADAAPAEGHLTIDGLEIPLAALGSALPIDPGEHRVVMRWPDRSASASVHLVEGDEQSVVLRPDSPAVEASPELVRIQPIAPPPPPPRGTNSIHRTVGWLAVGVGAAGLATWATAGLVAVGKRRTLLEHCPNGDCPPTYHDDLDNYRTLRSVSTVGFIAGIAGLGVGTVLVLTAPQSTQEMHALRWRASVALNGVTLTGEY